MPSRRKGERKQPHQQQSLSSTPDSKPSPDPTLTTQTTAEDRVCKNGPCRRQRKQSCWQDVGDRNWYCKTCWDKFETSKERGKPKEIEKKRESKKPTHRDPATEGTSTSSTRGEGKQPEVKTKSRSRKPKPKKSSTKNNLKDPSVLNSVFVSVEMSSGPEWEWAREWWRSSWASSQLQYQVYPQAAAYLLVKLLSDGGYFSHLTVSLGLAFYRSLAQTYDPNSIITGTRNPPSYQQGKTNLMKFYGYMGDIKRYSRDPSRESVNYAATIRSSHMRKEYNSRNCIESQLHPGYPYYGMEKTLSTKHLLQYQHFPLSASNGGYLDGDYEFLTAMVEQHHDDVIAILLDNRPKFVTDIVKSSSRLSIDVIATVSIPLLERILNVVPPSGIFKTDWSGYTLQNCLTTTIKQGEHPSKHDEVVRKIKVLIDYAENQFSTELDEIQPDDRGEEEEPAESDDHTTPPHHHHHPMLRKCLERIGDSRTYYNRDRNLMSTAVSVKNLKLLRFLSKEYGLSVNLKKKKTSSEVDPSDFSLEAVRSRQLLLSENPLHTAVEIADVDLIETLVKEFYADLHWWNKEQGSPLYWATVSGHLEAATIAGNIVLPSLRENVVLKLLELGAAVDYGSSDGTLPPPLVAFIKNKVGWTQSSDVSDSDLQIVKLYCERGADLEQTDKDGKTPFLLASEKKGMARVLKQLALFGADVNKRDPASGDTPLHLAYDLENARMLIDDFGADKFAVNRQGLTPIHAAANSGRTDVLQAFTKEDLEYQLLKSGPQSSLMLSNQEGMTPLMFASQNGWFACVRFLVEERKVEVDTQNAKGFTALYLAALAGREEAAKVLLNNKADVNKVSKTGATPLYIAAAKGRVDVVRLLVEKYDAVISIANAQGKTPLQIATESEIGRYGGYSAHRHCVAILEDREKEFLSEVK